MNATPQTRHKSSLLVIDDASALTALIEQNLRPRGYQVHSYNRYDGAFERVKAIRPDMLLLDVMLGSGAGYQISRQVRSHPELFKMPILFISSLGDMREVEHAFAQGADGYLVKPFTLNDLLQRLQMLDQLRQSIGTVDPLTGLLRVEAMEREVDFRLLRGEEFALAYIVVTEFSAYRNRKGPERADGVLVRTARMIETEVRDLRCCETRLAHLGAGHYLLLAKVEDYARLCKHVSHAFTKLHQEFYTAEELEQGYVVASKQEGTYSGYPLMHLHISVANTGKQEFNCARDLIHRLRVMQKKNRNDDKERFFCYKQKLKW